ncbi:MAG: hypothetical protein ACK56I_03870, partial [bacterium]
PAAAGRPEEVGRVLVGHVEREVADQRQTERREEPQPGMIPHENPVRLLPGEEPEDAELSRLLDPRRGEEDRRAGGAGCRHGLAILADIGEVGVQAPGPGGDRGL